MARDTLTKRGFKAQAKSAGALSLFRSAAKQLEEAAQEHKQVALTAGAIASEHRLYADDHAKQAEDAAKAAAKLRELVGGEK